MQLNKIDDPRDRLEKARRKELERFAETHNVAEIKPGMPAMLMRKILRRRGLTDIRIPHRPLGGQSRANSVVPDSVAQEDVASMDAADLLAAEWEQPSVSEMSITELRKACKAKGIPLARTDKKTDLIGKLNGDTA